MYCEKCKYYKEIVPPALGYCDKRGRSTLYNDKCKDYTARLDIPPGLEGVFDVFNKRK